MPSVVCIYTGQGAAGGLSAGLAIYTGQFSSCSPVVLFNRNTGRGGCITCPGSAAPRPCMTTGAT